MECHDATRDYEQQEGYRHCHEPHYYYYDGSPQRVPSPPSPSTQLFDSLTKCPSLVVKDQGQSFSMGQTGMGRPIFTFFFYSSSPPPQPCPKQPYDDDNDDDNHPRKRGHFFESRWTHHMDCDMVHSLFHSNRRMDLVAPFPRLCCR